MSEKVNEKAKYTFTGCMFLGMGLGYFLGYFIVGMFVGMGVGFLGLFLYIVNRSLMQRELNIKSHPFLDESIHLHH